MLIIPYSWGSQLGGYLPASKTSSGARSKETAGTVIRPRGSYMRREKDLGNIDIKYASVE
jgi:hypothetical protein